QVGAPHLRELEAWIGDVELEARGAGAGHGFGFVCVRGRIERARVAVVKLVEAGQDAGLANLVRHPHVWRRPCEDPGPESHLRTLLSSYAPTPPSSRSAE